MAVTPGRRGSARVVTGGGPGEKRAPPITSAAQRRSSTPATAEQQGTGARRRRTATETLIRVEDAHGHTRRGNPDRSGWVGGESLGLSFEP